MDIQAIILAKKYARAFMNLHGRSISYAAYKKIIELAEYVRNHKNILLYFNLPHITTEYKLDLLSRMGTTIESADPLKKLFIVLIEHRRCHLMPFILQSICSIYREKNRIRRFDIQSSSPLSEDDLTCIKEFLARKTGCTIEYTSSINKKLIAGLRFKSDTLLWEHSINNQLKALKKAFALNDQLVSQIEEKSDGN